MRNEAKKENNAVKTRENKKHPYPCWKYCKGHTGMHSTGRKSQSGHGAELPLMPEEIYPTLCGSQRQRRGGVY